MKLGQRNKIDQTLSSGGGGYKCTVKCERLYQNWTYFSNLLMSLVLCNGWKIYISIQKNAWFKLVLNKLNIWLEKNHLFSFIISTPQTGLCPCSLIIFFAYPRPTTANCIFSFVCSSDNPPKLTSPNTFTVDILFKCQIMYKSMVNQYCALDGLLMMFPSLSKFSFFICACSQC
jgi:hypothetical protein